MLPPAEHGAARGLPAFEPARARRGARSTAAVRPTTVRMRPSSSSVDAARACTRSPAARENRLKPECRFGDERVAAVREHHAAHVEVPEHDRAAARCPRLRPRCRPRTRRARGGHRTRRPGTSGWWSRLRRGHRRRRRHDRRSRRARRRRSRRLADVDGDVGAERAAQVPLLRRARGGDDACAERGAELHRGRADSAGRRRARAASGRAASRPRSTTARYATWNGKKKAAADDVVERRRRVEHHVGVGEHPLGMGAERAGRGGDHPATEPRARRRRPPRTTSPTDLHAQRVGQRRVDRAVAAVAAVDLVEVERRGAGAPRRPVPAPARAPGPRRSRGRRRARRTGAPARPASGPMLHRRLDDPQRGRNVRRPMLRGGRRTACRRARRSARPPPAARRGFRVRRCARRRPRG